MENRCAACGAVIPEGLMVCQSCYDSEERTQTNYDRIMSMGVKELAEFMCLTTDCCVCKGFCYCVADAGHANGLIKWLKKEVADDGEE